MKRVMVVVGARPNFMKAASLMRHGRASPKIEPLLVHTGQHYDYELSRAFFEQLGLGEPDLYLGVGSDTHARQTAKAIRGLREAIKALKPHAVLVVGDVNSTLAGAVAALEAGLPLVHVEAGYRTRDLNQPEEVNRIAADLAASLWFPSSLFAADNLAREGADPSRIFYCGNINLDPYFTLKEKIEASPILRELGLEPRGYAFMTMHRPKSVDDPETLRKLLQALDQVSRMVKLVFPVHPRTEARLRQFGLSLPERILALKPLPYIETIKLIKESLFVLTDSGGIQDETTLLGVPCLTMREHTEKPETLFLGTNRLVGREPERIVREVERLLGGDLPRGEVPELWDGRTGERIVGVLEREL